MSYVQRLLGRLDFFDFQAFMALHHAFPSELMDAVMIAFSSSAVGVLLLLLIAGYRLLRSTRFGWRETLLLLAAVGITDATAGLWLKPLFGRLRPCKAMVSIREVVACSGEWSFPSNHAANMAAAATVIFLMGRFPGWLVRTLFALTLITGYSRIYLAQHYPFDILTGYLLGAFIAWLVITAAKAAQFFYPAR